MKTFRIFLSSPGDCAEERNSVQEIVDILNADPLVNTFTRIIISAWDQGKGIPMDVLNSPQAAVNKHLPPPEVCDLFIGIFHCRLGTPLPIRELRKLDGSPFLSGSEYEFHRAWEARQRGASQPEILIYRRQEAPVPCDDAQQLSKLEDFFRQQPFQEDGQCLSSVTPYQDPLEFSAKLDADLRTLLSRHRPGGNPPFNDWLKRQGELVIDNAGPRYTANAHVESDIGLAFDWLLARQPAISALDGALREVWEEIHGDPTFSDALGGLEQFAEVLRDDVSWHTAPDFEVVLGTLRCIRERAWTELESHEAVEARGERDEERQRRQYRLRESAIKAEDTIQLLERYSHLAQRRVLLLTGPAGQGKTHTLVHEIRRTLAEGGITLGVLGQSLSASGDLWPAICSRVGWPDTYLQLLDTLEHEAARRNQRALLVIDALNETPHRTRWRRELTGMLREVLHRPHLALAISVRNDYLPQTLPPLADGAETPWVRWEHPGFTGIEPIALQRYFEHYGVNAPVAPPLGEFANPLYVQLLAKSMRGHSLRHWLPSWLEVWRGWMDRIEDHARSELGLDDASRQKAMRRIMEKFAETMLEDGRFLLPRQRADKIAFEIARVERVVDFLCSAGALIDSLDDGSEVIEFGFERLSDTFLADRLLNGVFKDQNTMLARRDALRVALGPGGTLHALSVVEFSTDPLHSHRTGLLEALCLAVPQLVGIELIELITNDDSQWPDWPLADAFNDSLRWRARPEEFGAAADDLYTLWRDVGRHGETAEDFDELIRLGLIPGHPFAMEKILHPMLLMQESMGARDALWSVHLVPLWADDNSNLRQVVVWARDSRLQGVHRDIVLPAARLLAWVCASSQKGLRQAAMQGLSRLVATCPQVLGDFLPDFLEVNDPYVLEAVLLAVWGAALGGDAGAPALTLAARRVYDSQFPEENARWQHVSLRHYARRIVEEAHRRGWLPDVDLNLVQPPYRSTLPLDDVPDKNHLKALDASRGFGRIVFSSMEDRFYRYIIGGNHPDAFDFSSETDHGSPEPSRPFLHSEYRASQHANAEVFDLALAARFVVWSCRQMGWTAERFDNFDTGPFTGEYHHIDEGGRTERVGKKYQWIGWHNLLGFLADNYAMRPERSNRTNQYDTPDQLNVPLHDPSRWLQIVAPGKRRDEEQDFWRISGLPPWPRPDLADMVRWVASRSHDLQPADVIATVPNLPSAWGDGAWLRLAADHSWDSYYAPGQWALGNAYHATIWWECWPLLIHSSDLPALLQGLTKRRVRMKLIGSGALGPDKEWHVPLPAWPTITPPWDQAFCRTRYSGFSLDLAVPWRSVIAYCGHPDRRDEHAPVLLPVPSLFRQWDLRLDLQHGLVLYHGKPLFGVAGWLFGEKALFVRRETLLELLDVSGYALIWWWRGERRACLDCGIQCNDDADLAWADYHGIGYLGTDGRVQTAMMDKQLVTRR